MFNDKETICDWCTNKATHYCVCGKPLCDSSQCEYDHVKDEVENPYI